MATKFIQLDDAAEMLGMTPEDLNEMRSRNEIRGFRDGATWKFKSDEIDRIMADRQTSGGAADEGAIELGGESDLKLGDELADAGEESVLLSERELGGSDVVGSSTVIGETSDDPSADSDIVLAEEGADASDKTDLQLVGDSMLQGSDISPEGGSGMQTDSVADETGSDEEITADTGSGLSLQFEELDSLELDMDDDDKPESTPAQETPTTDQETPTTDVDAGSDLSLSGNDDLSLGGEDELGLDAGSGTELQGDSSIDLSDDDDLVLGGSGSGSDITIGASDSGISLMDPADSGLSLEGDALELGGSAIGEESLVLGEDDMIMLGDDAGADTTAPTQLKSDDDFLLTPLEEAEDESESGSQVIALDDAGAGLDQSAATMLAEGEAGMAMLEEDLADAETLVGGPAAAGAAGVASLAAAPQVAAGGVMLPAIPEAPYSIWNVLSLFVCIVVLSFTGMLMYDVVRQIWSWDGAHPVNSGMMESIISMFK